MKIYKLSNMTRGWFIGDFEPSVLRTSEFEVGLLHHQKGERWAAHYHKSATEYNILISGLMKVQNTLIHSGDIFVFDKYEISDPEFLEDCKVLCVKTPSIKNDKFEV
jgi:quercetin dioxygenase-like cupin family protein